MHRCVNASKTWCLHRLQALQSEILFYINMKHDSIIGLKKLHLFEFLFVVTVEYKKISIIPNIYTKQLHGLCYKKEENIQHRDVFHRI